MLSDDLSSFITLRIRNLADSVHVSHDPLLISSLSAMKQTYKELFYAPSGKRICMGHTNAWILS